MKGTDLLASQGNSHLQSNSELQYTVWGERKQCNEKTEIEISNAQEKHNANFARESDLISCTKMQQGSVNQKQVFTLALYCTA